MSQKLNVQFTGFVSIMGSKEFDEETKAAMIGKTINVNVNGHNVAATIIPSSSGGLTARFAFAEKGEVGAPKTEKTEKPKSTKAAQNAAAVRAMLAPESNV